MLSIIRLLFIFNVMFLGVLIAGPSEIMQSLHKEISDKLIALRNEYPKAQSQVYAVLDSLGKFNSEGQATCKALVAAEQKILHQEQENKARIDELNSLKTKAAQASSQVEALNKKLATYQAAAKQAAEKLVAQAKSSEAAEPEKNTMTVDTSKKT